MNRKDLFTKGFRSLAQFGFEKVDQVSELVEEAWKETSPPKPSSPKVEDVAYANKPIPPKKKKTVQNVSLPPGAVLNFFEVCTGCNQCVFACPYNVLFPIPTKLGKMAPAFDPNAKACHLCEDYPCISACPESALLPFENLDEMPKFGKAIALGEHCLNAKTGENSCNVCLMVCPVEKTVQFKENLPSFKSSTCTGCGLCVEACPSFPKAIQIKLKSLPKQAFLD